MIEEITRIIPADIIKFLLVFLFALLIGLEQRRRYISEDFESLFGTDRTFTLLGVLGYILYIISPYTLVPFLCGGGAVSVILGIYYFQRINAKKLFGITSIVIALIAYCLAPLVYTQPNWLVLLILVSVLVVSEIKETLFEFSKKVDNSEFITLAKFMVLAGVILPLLPDTPISEQINVSPYKFSLSIVAVSAISYFSYLLKKYVFPQSGIILTGILGGMYSSTATTIILARKSKEMTESNKAAAAIILATTMMYLRLFLLALFFNQVIAIHLLPYFLIFIVVNVLLALYFYKSKKVQDEGQNATPIIESHGNPLELKTAIVFGFLFIFFTVITGYVSKIYGRGGINILSLVVGVTDIDPFILNLLQGKFNMESSVVVMAVLNAVSSNNLLKMVYGATLCNRSIRKQLIVGFSVLTTLGLLMSFVFHV